MPELTLVLDQKSIAEKVAALAKQISSDYRNADLVVIGVLKGAFVFMADLIRHLNIDRMTVDFIRLASYGDKDHSNGHIDLLKDAETDLKGKDLLIVEDILDTGLTLAFLRDHLKSRQPRSVKACVLIDKCERRQVDIKADYVCHKVKEGFLVGYGLDYGEAYRNLPGIYHLNFNA
ncbi:hypoxanthine phosphoribosyltransferase [Desulfatitalea tepidiphila]|uniref:hypoxanthine phosphoribosyltransferase n=1 Tax=Desulfatitalea tepidiphila TaxID=1185843 RepID=UPI0006B6636D|nr:hypoxanthine phosphoribosyltransferase [Desulfatitalea tepidiphila]